MTSGIITELVTNMNYTFSDCKNLESINLLSFDTSEVTIMDHMFYNNYNLLSLDLSSFETNQVTNMDYMFANWYSLQTLNISKFNSTKASIQEIFTNSTELVDIISTDEKICDAKPGEAKCISN